MDFQRRLPIGAEPQRQEGTHFRVWAPKRKRVELVLEPHGTSSPLSAEGNGYFSGLVNAAGPGTLYRYRLDGEGPFPDPASRFQPEGPHGPSQVVDSNQYRWQHLDWPGTKLKGQVIYELHIGTFSPEGNWSGAIARLPKLAEVGITLLEVMPVSEFSGQFGWGYDGVNMFAPTRLYGSTDDFRRFVDAAHGLGMGVILDVVYNHFGPDGNYTGQYSDYYVSRRYKNEWGDAINFDDEFAGPVREYFISNATYWIDEFHLDGLRLDATQQIFDSSPNHVLAEISRATRAAAGKRSILLIAENERQQARLVRPLEQGGYGLDAVWNDDLHHSARVAMTGRREAYYLDYQGTAQELLSAVKWGFLYQGQRYKWQKARRGYPSLDVRPEQFVTFLENHDQVANSACGERPFRMTSLGRYRALAALILLSPGTPMLFQGQEFGSTSPFLFFADHNPELAELVAKGRAEFLTQFPSVAVPDVQKSLPQPHDRATFERCKLDWSERERHGPLVSLYRDLLRMRREDPAFRAQRKGSYDGAVLSEDAFVLRFFVDGGNDRLLLVNLGKLLHLDPAPEPLLAPPEDKRWQTLWSSDSHEYSGYGTPDLDTEENWKLPAECAVVLVPAPVDESK